MQNWNHHTKPIHASPIHASLILASLLGLMHAEPCEAVEKQITNAPHGHILTNMAVWSPDSQWIVYDVRSDPAGDRFDSTRIEQVQTETGKVQVLYESKDGAHCGVATYSPSDDRVIFIHGPEHPDQQWQYAAYHRRGVIIDANHPGKTINLDARDLTPPFTQGALRGGTHVHTFSDDGTWVAFTYEDHILQSPSDSADHDSADHDSADHDSADRHLNQRNVGVSVANQGVRVPNSHPHNHHGSHFSLLVTQTENRPAPGSDEISRAYSNAWVGENGYIRPDGNRQRRAIAFLGDVRNKRGQAVTELFVVDLPDRVWQPQVGRPLQGTRDRRPYPPQGSQQRRLTFTVDRKYPGIQGVRHWPQSSPDGSQIAFLMKDDAGVSQLWTFSPNGGTPRQITENEHDIASAFSWSPDGTSIAHVMNQAICMTELKTGQTTRLTEPKINAPLRPEACVVSPCGSRIAYLREVLDGGERWNQIFTVAIPSYRGRADETK